MSRLRRVVPERVPKLMPSACGLHLTSEDVEDVLTGYAEALDVSRDLHKLFHELLGRAPRRALVTMFEP